MCWRYSRLWRPWLAQSSKIISIGRSSMTSTRSSSAVWTHAASLFFSVAWYWFRVCCRALLSAAFCYRWHRSAPPWSMTTLLSPRPRPRPQAKTSPLPPTCITAKSGINGFLAASFISARKIRLRRCRLSWFGKAPGDASRKSTDLRDCDVSWQNGQANERRVRGGPDTVRGNSRTGKPTRQGRTCIPGY